MKKRFKKVILVVVIIAIIIGSNVITAILSAKTTKSRMESQTESEVNSLVEQRLAEITTSNPVTQSNSGSTPSSDSFGEDSYHDFTPGSNNSSAITSEASKVTASISNTTKPNAIKSFKDLEVFETQLDAFNNATILPSGIYVSIKLNSSTEVKKISAEISMFNPETDEFEHFSSEDFEVSSGSEQKVDFKIPNNPYVSRYTNSTINCVIVVTVETADGNYFVGCAY